MAQTKCIRRKESIRTSLMKLAVLTDDARFSDKWNNSGEAVDVRASEGKSKSKTLTTVWVQFSYHAALQQQAVFNC